MQPIRLMGDRYEPHVDRVGDRLTYSLPVDSGIVSFSFTFDIFQADLEVLVSKRPPAPMAGIVLYQHVF